MLHLARQINNFRNMHFMIRWMGTIKKFHLPDLGQKIKEGTVKKWYVKQGDVVEEFQKIADIASDKQFTELTSSDSGKIHRLHYPEEAVCQVGQLLLELQLKDGKDTKDQKQNEKEKDSHKPKIETTSTQKQQTCNSELQNSNIDATPAVRHLVKEHKLNIKDIKGTGKNGRILKEDVLNFVEQKKSGQKSEIKSPPIKQQHVEKPSTVTEISKVIVTMNSFQKGMQKTMTQSNTIPQLLMHEEADITELFKVRQQIKKSTGKSLTFMTFFIKFFSAALSETPILNSLYDPSNPFEFTTYQNHNITIAIDTSNGLAVPNIKNVQNLSLFQIQEELTRLRTLAESAKLTKADIQNGTISMSNIGAVGAGTYAGPLILPPQVCITAIGNTSTLPRFDHNNIEKVIPRKITPLSFSCDHRVIDGGTIARFAKKWKSYLEHPYVMIAHLK